VTDRLTDRKPQKLSRLGRITIAASRRRADDQCGDKTAKSAVNEIKSDAMPSLQSFVYRSACMCCPAARYAWNIDRAPALLRLTVPNSSAVSDSFSPTVIVRYYKTDRIARSAFGQVA